MSIYISELLSSRTEHLFPKVFLAEFETVGSYKIKRVNRFYKFTTQKNVSRFHRKKSISQLHGHPYGGPWGPR